MNLKKQTYIAMIIAVAAIALAILIPVAIYNRQPEPPVSPLKAQAVEIVQPPSSIPQFMGKRALTNTINIYWTLSGDAGQPVTHIITEASVITLGFHTALVDKAGNTVAQQTFILSPALNSTEIIPTGLFMPITYSYPYTVTGHGILTETISAAWYVDGDIVKLNDVVRTVNSGWVIYLPVIMK